MLRLVAVVSDFLILGNSHALSVNIIGLQKILSDESLV